MCTELKIEKWANPDGHNWRVIVTCMRCFRYAYEDTDRNTSIRRADGKARAVLYSEKCSALNIKRTGRKRKVSHG